MSPVRLARVVALLTAMFCAPASASTDVEWLTDGPDGQPGLVLYYFYSDSCPHCQEAKPFVAGLGEMEWIDLRRYEVSKNRENGLLYRDIAASVGEKARSVPGFLFCGTLRTGYDKAETTGARLLEELRACRADPDSYLAPAEEAAMPQPAEVSGLQLPLVGTIDPSNWGLPILTAIIAGLDAFNPCAFFVLLFLLSLMVHARSRARMLLVGGTFVLFSGAIYFVFMAAWLNVFLWIGELRIVTVIAGLIAVTLAAVNIKDYFWFKSGPSLSIPDSKKPGMYQRMRNLVAAPSVLAMLTGTAVLAIVVNSYELLCTAGLPMVYTRILTLREADSFVFYMYLLFYNVIYVIPLLAIVGLFVMKFGSRKLGESEGRLLKLMSGMMMLGLGAVMLFAPMSLNNAGIAIGLLAAAVLATALIHAVMKRRGLI
ncbi:thioredoxin family protein [Lentisalinibacter salinarum]|uniref:thioredoxin family protein n=1 Tax=Lentisalinibacter salinarum TaxID=2992239 RepID=UPI00386A32FF